MTKQEVKQEHKQSEGDPLRQGRDPLPAARGRPQPDDGRRRRPPTSCWSTRPTSRSRCATTPSAAPPGWSPGAPARSPRKIREQAAEHRVPLVRDVPLARALLRAPARSARRSRPSSSPRSPRCSRSSSAGARRASAAARTAAPGPASTLPAVPAGPAAPRRSPQTLRSRPPPADGRPGRQDGVTTSCHGRRDTVTLRKACPRDPKRLTQLGGPRRRRAHRRDAGRAAARRRCSTCCIALNITGVAADPAGRDVRAAGRSTSPSFPAVHPGATLFRLALNVSATRLVLLDGYAGKVIEAFGHFVVGGSLVVGLVIFLILRGHPVRRHHQRRRPRRRGRRPLHPRRDARQADGDRRRPQRRPHRRGRGPPPPRARSPPRPTSTARWTVRSKFVKGDAIAGDHHHAGQPDRRLRHRRRPEGHGARRGDPRPTAC